MNAYTEIIKDNLNIEISEAEKIQEFVNNWFEFRWSSATKSQIIRTAKEAQAMMTDPRYSAMASYKDGE